MARIEELEILLDCKIRSEVKTGESLEKYYAILNDRNVMLRIYDNSYYTNRFLREGLILRNSDKLSTPHIKIPRIIDEWPEYSIRAIEWFEFEEKDVSKSDLKKSLSTIQSFPISLPYKLRQDLIPHLLNTDKIHIAYREFFTEKVDLLLDHIDWDDGKQGVIHGDFHPQNIGISDDVIVVYDWEYATFGSEFYDQAYLGMMDPNIEVLNVPTEWELLVLLVNSHWYLQEDRFSPKEAIKWVDKIGDIEL